MTTPRVEQYRFGIPIYGVQVVLVRSHEAAYVHLLQRYDRKANDKEDNPRGSDGRTVLLTSAVAPPIVVIWVRDAAILSHPVWIGILAHECWHAVCRVLDNVGMAPNPATEEAYAYLHGWLVRECVTRLQPKPHRLRTGAHKK